MKRSFYLLAIFISFLAACTQQTFEENTSTQPVHQDVSFRQDFSVKYYLNEEDITLNQVFSDRNGVIQLHSSAGLLRTHAGAFLYPGTLVADEFYLALKDKNIASIGVYEDQFVYLDDKAVLSNAWAGSLYSQHSLPGALIFAGGPDFAFLISDGQALQYLKDSEVLWEGKLPNDEVLDIRFDATKDLFWILGERSVSAFSIDDNSLAQVFEGNGFTCFDLAEDNGKIIVGTREGYWIVDAATRKAEGEIKAQLPWPELTAIREIDGNLWLGSTQGAFMLRDDGKYNYYYGERWLPGNQVRHIAAGENGAVLILTDAGLGEIRFQSMTLHEKALYYEQQVRDRHIRFGFNATLGDMEKGNIDTGTLDDSDNDGLWTSMYLGGQVFRYAVTQSEEALQNCRESLDAMERLYTINPVPGFPSRSFERRGYIEVLSDPERWQHAEDPEWDWKATTSSDEAIGHVFVFGAIAELIDDEALQQQAIRLLDTLMQHVIDNDWYLVDYDGKPTTWGKWNPEYVNARPTIVGDRKLNSSNIIAMLQTAYHFTHKEIYKEKAFELMEEHGYLENLMRPISEIGRAPEDADEWSRMLSQSWNHSDDEMYFLGYWGLYRYAFNDSLKAMYKEAIIDHWEAERPEKEGAWNIFTAMTGTPEFDLEEAIWYLQEYPMDLITWGVKNSHRKDIVPVEPNFRNQTIEEVLPPDELRISRHNANRFTLDGGGNGTSEYSAGDIWLLPYWMGRYLGVISAPVDETI